MFKAIFRGENGSMGLQTGNPYTLQVKQALVGKGFSVLIKETGMTCPYSSLETFVQNWSEIQYIR